MNKHIWTALIWAGVILMTPLIMRWLHAEGVIPVGGEELSERTTGIVTGLVLIAFANILPKQAPPIADSECEPARAQSLRRFSARAFVLSGFLWVIAWIAAPIDVANLIAMTTVGAALVVVLARCLLSRMTQMAR